jgi:hypothetical protein
LVSGHSDSIRERRAREVRVWREEEDEAKATIFEPRAWTLGLFCAQRFQTPDEAAEAIMRIRQGRLSLEYLMWNGKTTPPLLPTDRY